MASVPPRRRRQRVRPLHPSPAAPTAEVTPGRQSRTRSTRCEPPPARPRAVAVQQTPRLGMGRRLRGQAPGMPPRRPQPEPPWRPRHQTEPACGDGDSRREGGGATVRAAAAPQRGPPRRRSAPPPRPPASTLATDTEQLARSRPSGPAPAIGRTSAVEVRRRRRQGAWKPRAHRNRAAAARTGQRQRRRPRRWAGAVSAATPSPMTGKGRGSGGGEAWAASQHQPTLQLTCRRTSQ